MVLASSQLIGWSTRSHWWIGAEAQPASASSTAAAAAVRRRSELDTEALLLLRFLIDQYDGGAPVGGGGK